MVNEGLKKATACHAGCAKLPYCALTLLNCLALAALKLLAPRDDMAWRNDYRVALSRLIFSGIVLMPGQFRLGLPTAWQPRQSDLVFPNQEPPDSIIDFWT